LAVVAASCRRSKLRCVLARACCYFFSVFFGEALPFSAEAFRYTPNNDNRKPLQITTALALRLLKMAVTAWTAITTHTTNYAVLLVISQTLLTHMMLSKKEMKNYERSCKLFYISVFLLYDNVKKKENQEKGDARK